jgi:hypothetical protein
MEEVRRISKRDMRPDSFRAEFDLGSWTVARRRGKHFLGRTYCADQAEAVQLAVTMAETLAPSNPRGAP